MFLFDSTDETIKIKHYTFSAPTGAEGVKMSVCASVFLYVSKVLELERDHNRELQREHEKGLLRD